MKFIRLFNTVKYLKLQQIYYRIFYLIRNRIRKLMGFQYLYQKESQSSNLKLQNSINSNSEYLNRNFNFLNLSKNFNENIDWNYSKYGKLWTYNLTYFEYLKKEEDLFLIYDFIENIENVKDGIEPFPISLRGISWIKFLSKFKIKDKKVDDSLYGQYYILCDNLEYHLLGNHLLENGFSLLFGAYYFEDVYLYKKAKDILEVELKEQILLDGAHFEISPMYHQIMLFRVLDCINLVKNNKWQSQELLKLLEDKSKLMLGWLKNITFSNGNIPLLNDSTNKIAPTSLELFDYASNLNLQINNNTLQDSGYRKIIKENYELVLDIGKVGSEYIPGHAHADTFSFELYINNKPFVIDTGLSTYNISSERDFERSTKAHNTVEINCENSSEVWSGFRVADRAVVSNIIEKENYIKATHNGYKKKFNILHTRECEFQEHKIIITDSLSKVAKAISRIHFHPSVTKEDIETRIRLENLDYKIEKYFYAPEFNKRLEALVLEVLFTKDLKMEIFL